MANIETQGRGRLFSSILGTVGDTPTILLNYLGPDHVEIYVKAEAFNPAGSVKDRLALAIIETAERNGSLKQGQTVIEATPALVWPWSVQQKDTHLWPQCMMGFLSNGAS